MRFALVLSALVLAAAVATASGSASHGDKPPNMSIAPALAGERLAARGGCKSVSTCREAVEMWCGGYSRADGDGDGIPCENVCSSRREVDRIRAEIGC